MKRGTIPLLTHSERLLMQEVAKGHAEPGLGQAPVQTLGPVQV